MSGSLIMGDATGFLPAKLFCGVIFRLQSDYLAAKATLEARISPSDLESAPFPFTQTDYYAAEMGSPLYRRFTSFVDPVAPERLAEIKLATSAVEKEMSVAGSRRVNLDPGILSDHNVIIATSKNFYHRVPLRDGIYAHLEYVFRRGQWEPLEWTYPDFRSRPYRDFFLCLRAHHLKNR